MEWFSKWPQITQMITVVFLMGLGYLAIKNGVNFTLGKFGISFRNKLKKQKINYEYASEDNPHFGCPNMPHLYLLIADLTDLIFKKSQLTIGTGLLRTQMDYAKMKGDVIIGIIQKVYLNELMELREGISSNLVKSVSFSIYNLILAMIKENILEMFLQYFENNHLYRMTSSEYKDYKEEKIITIFQKVTTLLNENYFYEEDINREKIYEVNMKKVNEVSKLFDDIFDKAYELSKENHDTIDKINCEMSKLLSNKNHNKVLD